VGTGESINFGGDDVGIERWPRALAAASFTAGGIETLSVSREAGQPLIPNQEKIRDVFEALACEPGDSALIKHEEGVAAETVFHRSRISATNCLP
jgi:hypothetical protein